MNNDVLAIILWGGQGTRLFPLTPHRSKPAVPIGGSYPLIEDASAMGILRFDRSGKIVAFEEKPKRDRLDATR